MPKPVGAHFLGLLAFTYGAPELARRHFEEATQAHEAVGAPLLLAETQLELARLLVSAGGSTAESGRLIDSVRAVAVPRGALFLCRSCDEIDVSARP